MEGGKYWILNQMTCIVFVSHDHHHHCFQELDGEYLSSIKDPTIIINICYDFSVNFKRYLLLERMAITPVKTITIESYESCPKKNPNWILNSSLQSKWCITLWPTYKLYSINSFSKNKILTQNSIAVDTFVLSITSSTLTWMIWQQALHDNHSNNIYNIDFIRDLLKPSWKWLH